MKKFVVLLAAIALLGLTASVWAQGPGGPGMGHGPGLGPGLYNPQTVTTMKGTVETLTSPGLRRRTTAGLMLKTDQGSLPVHLGPFWYLQQQGITLQVGDPLEVTGSQVTMQGKPALIAREVKVDGNTLKLRDEQGLPLWRGGRPLPAPEKAAK